MLGSTRVKSTLHWLTLLFIISLISAYSFAGSVEIKKNQLFVDDIAQPQLFGAELQYFRLRGGTGRNISREKVIAYWNQALDRMVDAKMNAISFYIPWDFHEYANNKFDFTGSVDEDGDGLPDYPSRDLVTFFRLIKEHGIQHIMIRPGPYINAEWGFLGFGAVPEWFHEQFPDSHMLNSLGQRTKLYDYTNPDFRYFSQRWLQELYNQVLVHYIGPGQPIDFIQLDNETNYQWQSLYNLDYGPRSIEQYRQFLQKKYGSLAKVNEIHHRNWSHWDQVQAPIKSGLNVAEDVDWYRFHDETIYEYLHFVRQVWENLGVKEPSVMFTLAESYNAPKDGLLPHYHYRNDPGVTGLMTVNLYPKTNESDLHPLMNQPFKADHDVKATSAANEKYFGQRQEWAFGPEIQGGWWRGIPVSQEARLQTYLSTIGHGLKALFIYYFNEGDNFGYDWAKNKVQPLFQALRQQPPYVEVLDEHLPQEFWDKLQTQSDQQLLVGIDVRSAILGDSETASQLYFDAALDATGSPKKNYALVKNIGETLIADHGAFLGLSLEMTDPVCMIKDSNQHVPSKISGIESNLMNSEWAGGLLGLMMQSGVNPKIVHWGITSREQISQCRLLIVQDNGVVSPKLSKYLKGAINKGKTVLNLLSDDFAKDMGLLVEKTNAKGSTRVFLSSDPTKALFELTRTPYSLYDLKSSTSAQAFLQDEAGRVIGYRLRQGKGQFIQISGLFYEKFNSDFYGTLNDVHLYRAIVDEILSLSDVQPRIKIRESINKVVAFGRENPEGNDFLIVTKSAHTDKPVDFHIMLRDADKTKTYHITNILPGGTMSIKGIDLVSSGFPVSLPANGSAVFRIQNS